LKGCSKKCQRGNSEASSWEEGSKRAESFEGETKSERGLLRDSKKKRQSRTHTEGAKKNFQVGLSGGLLPGWKVKRRF